MERDEGTRTADEEQQAEGVADDRGVSRRRWLKAGGAALAGAGAVTLLPTAAKAEAGDELVLGDYNNATTGVTRVWVAGDTTSRGFVVDLANGQFTDLTPLSGAVIGVTNAGYAGVTGQSVRGSGVVGRSTHYLGVEGRSTNEAGVWGESTNNIGVVGRSAAGSGVRGESTSANGVVAVSQNASAVYAVCANSDGVFAQSTSAYGVRGRSTNLTGVIGEGPAYGVRGSSARTWVWGESTGAAGVYAGVEGTSTSNWGVHGKSSSATGVAGESTSGSGVSGTSANGTGVAGSGGVYGGEFRGTRAAARLVPATTAGAPSSGSHQMGELHCDRNGALWFCAAAGTPGTWKKVKLV